ncbi:MarR family winged helix-turn-helix transcriptional regulator [Longispora albida]|uniref:MarR family winged helix-turn-helix transcriptional regulator n=1 Tax=Longispora albida TaxID=203523 RepID=UPI00036424A1|nr:MarR family transcriptional regulator [Longispora albida]
MDLITDQWRTERPELDPTPIGVIGRMGRLSALLDKELKTFFAAHDLETWEFDVLATLRRFGEPYEMSMGALFGNMMVTSGAITNRVDRMAARGLVERCADPGDRRSVRVKLTPEGLRRVEAVVGLHLDNERRLLAPLSEDEHDQLAVLLKRLLLSLGDHA